MIINYCGTFRMFFYIMHAHKTDCNASLVNTKTSFYIKLIKFL